MQVTNLNNIHNMKAYAVEGALAMVSIYELTVGFEKAISILILLITLATAVLRWRSERKKFKQELNELKKHAQINNEDEKAIH